jgi:hypothetical protein
MEHQTTAYYPANLKKTILVLWQKDLTHKPSVFWPLGPTYISLPTVRHAWETIDHILKTHSTGYILFWDEDLGPPDPELIHSLQQEPADIWHAGLLLGTRGEPNDIDYISPTWTLNRDPDPASRAISWRLSLRACLIQVQVLHRLGQIDLAFESLEAAGLEMGYRYIWRGPIILHTPRMLVDQAQSPAVEISLPDRYTFIARHFDQVWLWYVFVRRCLANLNAHRERQSLRLALDRIKNAPPAFQPGATYVPERPVLKGQEPRISVLIPTLCRYTYLNATLNALRQQSIAPYEVICVDQTPRAERQTELYEQFSDLNLQVVWQDQPGQCSARNAGLAQVKGDIICFLDDDVEIGKNYLERLLAGLRLYQADISVGVWFQGKSYATQPMDRHYRASDRLDTGGSLAKKSTVMTSGGFDLRYDRNYRADADLGMRLYLSGALSVISPDAGQTSISPQTGGLKYFGASGNTLKTGLFHLWPAATQTYYWLRYFTPKQVREAFLLGYITSILPTKSALPTRFTQLAILAVKFMALLPFRIFGAWRSIHAARRMIELGPQIPGVANPN